MDERSYGEMREVEDVAVPKIVHGEITEVEDVLVPEISHGEIAEVEDVAVPEISHGEIVEVKDVSVPETSKVVDPRWTDWIYTLSRLNKLSEALLPTEFNPLKANEDEKSVGGSDDHHMPASDVTVAHCSCQINSAVKEDWEHSLIFCGCIKLMELLKRYPCLLAIHTRRGDTALHAAAQEGNLKLLVYICSLFLDDRGNAVKEYVHGDNKINRKAFLEKENDYQLTAKDCLWFTIGKTTMYAYFKSFVKFGRFDYSKNWNATLAAMQEEVSNPFYDNHPVWKRLKDYINGISEDKRGVNAKRRMKEIIMTEYNDRKTQLDGIFTSRERHVIAEYEELCFLHTLSNTQKGIPNIHRVNEREEYLRAVIRGCVEEGPDMVKYLFCHRNATGQTAFHIADTMTCAMLIEELPAGEEYTKCFNARDVRGWTALHFAIAEGVEGKVECLLKDTRVDVNARYDCGSWKKNSAALHLAIMHDCVKIVRLLLQRKDTNVNALYTKPTAEPTEGIGCNIQYSKSNLKHCTPLQLAVLLGRHEIIKALLNHPKINDPGLQNWKSLWPIGVRHRQNANEEKSNSNEKLPSMLSAIHIAGIMSDPKTLRCFLNISKFDLSVTI